MSSAFTTTTAHRCKAVAYIRVSTREQSTGGVSLPAQEEVIRAYCTMRRLQLVELVSDPGVTASRALAQREGGRRVLDLVDHGQASAVVAWKLDRIFRDAVDCLHVTRSWDRAGVALHLVDLGGQALDSSSAMGRFFLTVMAGAAELEKNLVAERTSAALAHVRATGVRLGAEALGWTRDDQCDEAGRRVVRNVDRERATIERIVVLRREGLSLRTIARVLQGEGHQTKRGGRWHASTVRAVLAREEP